MTGQHLATHYGRVSYQGASSSAHTPKGPHDLLGV